MTKRSKPTVKETNARLDNIAQAINEIYSTVLAHDRHILMLISNHEDKLSTKKVTIKQVKRVAKLNAKMINRVNKLQPEIKAYREEMRAKDDSNTQPEQA